MIYSFVDISLHLSSFASSLCKFIFRQMFKHGSLVSNVELNTALYSKQCAVRLIQASWNSKTVLLLSNSTS